MLLIHSILPQLAQVSSAKRGGEHTPWSCHWSHFFNHSEYFNLCDIIIVEVSSLSVKTTNAEVWLSWNRLAPLPHHISGGLTVYIVGKIRKAICLLLCPSFFPLSTPWNENFNLLVRIKSLNLFLYRSLNKFTGLNKVLLVLGQNDRCSSWGLCITFSQSYKEL
jgi:hypothetical protein